MTGPGCTEHIGHRVYVGGPNDGRIDHLLVVSGLTDFPLWTASLMGGRGRNVYVREPDIPPASGGQVTVPYYYAGSRLP